MCDPLDKEYDEMTVAVDLAKVIDYYVKGFKIIGNIFENSDLLKH